MQVKKSFFKKIFFPLYLIIGLSSSLVAAPLSPLLKQIESYLNSLRTVAATFQQQNAMGVKTSGRFYLWRPGLMRLEYNPPSQELIIADGTYITHIQRDLNEVSSMAIDSTPAVILLADRVDFEQDIKVIALEQHKGKIFLTLRRQEDTGGGELTLVFNADPLLLLEWIIKDVEGHLTHVVLDNIKTGVRLPKSLFILAEKY